MGNTIDVHKNALCQSYNCYLIYGTCSKAVKHGSLVDKLVVSSEDRTNDLEKGVQISSWKQASLNLLH